MHRVGVWVCIWEWVRVYVWSIPDSDPYPDLFCSFAVLNPRVDHTTDVLFPFISVLCHSDWLFHGESCLRLVVVHPGKYCRNAAVMMTVMLLSSSVWRSSGPPHCVEHSQPSADHQCRHCTRCRGRWCAWHSWSQTLQGVPALHWKGPRPMTAQNFISAFTLPLRSLSSQVVSMLDSGVEGPWFKS